MTPATYRCHYLDHGEPTSQGCYATQAVAEFYAKLLSRKYNIIITVCAHYENGGFRKIGFAEKEKFYYL